MEVKHEKVLAIALAMLMMLALFTGCGNDNAPASNGGADAPKEDEVYVLRIHHHDPRIPQ